MNDRPVWWDYVELYPESDEEGYDGVHDGGIKGLSDEAPPEMVEAYKKDMGIEENNVVDEILSSNPLWIFGIDK